MSASSTSEPSQLVSHKLIESFVERKDTSECRTLSMAIDKMDIEQMTLVKVCTVIEPGPDDSEMKFIQKFFPALKLVNAVGSNQLELERFKVNVKKSLDGVEVRDIPYRKGCKCPEDHADVVLMFHVGGFEIAELLYLECQSCRWLKREGWAFLSDSPLTATALLGEIVYDDHKRRNFNKLRSTSKMLTIEHEYQSQFTLDVQERDSECLECFKAVLEIFTREKPTDAGVEKILDKVASDGYAKYIWSILKFGMKY